MSSNGNVGSVGSTFGLMGSYAMVIATIGALIYLYVYVFKSIASINETIIQIKSKIGNVVRSINSVNQKTYSVELDQQTQINQLSI